MQAAIRIKSDFAEIAARYKDLRSSAEIIEHYLLERELADRLRNASRADRLALYGEVYAALFEKLPHHPQHTRRAVAQDYVEKQVAILRRFLYPGDCFVEVGAGDCRVAIAMAAYCHETIGIDVTEAVYTCSARPINFRFLLTNGVTFELAKDSVDFVYSNQLMEHLHPEDAAAQLAEIHRILRPGGRYFCITPSAISGPHDISRYFDNEATGFHLKEYTNAILGDHFVRTGFHDLHTCITRGGYYAGMLPLGLGVAFENLVSFAPDPLRRRLKATRLVQAVLGIALIGTKA